MKPTTITFIDTIAELEKAVSCWKKLSTIGIDLECENNLHHYGVYISLIQLSDGDHHWIIDTLSLSKEDLKIFVEVMEDRSIQKIFHDVNFDLRILSKDLDCHPVNLFDTQIAAKYLGKEEIGLGALLKDYFGFDKEKRFQKADWTKRPLTTEMIEYAASDSIYLIQLRDLLLKELVVLKRDPWVLEECERIEIKDLDYHMSTFWDIKGLHALSDIQRGIAKELFDLREKFAAKVDRPVYFLFSNKKLMAYSQEGIHPISFWNKMKGSHPIIRTKGKLFFAAERKGKDHPISFPEEEKLRLKHSQREIVHFLMDLREELALEMNLKSHLLITKDEVIQVAVDNSLQCLSKWQQAIFSEKVTFS